MEELQDVLVRELHSGILTAPSLSGTKGLDTSGSHNNHDDKLSASMIEGDSLNWLTDNTCMPELWVKAAMLVRINSLASGYSGVRPVIIENMMRLLENDVIPRVPLRGSISASGDLMPLSYIGGLLQGKPSLYTMIGNKTLGQRRAVRAREALRIVGIEPLRLAPKEGLAIINGTSVSAGLAALVTHDANGLAILAQILTAMSVEALCGAVESFDPLFTHVRPHPGQIDASSNISGFLRGSTLVNLNRGLEQGSLRQDRYSIRTAAQWIGPALEDLVLAFQQVSTECNSVTDNPLVDTHSPRLLHGGNFQAMAITSAINKIKTALQTIGQMLYAQCTELINPKANHGLPPNLVAADPSTSFLMKPLDIMIAALQSELGFLANHVSTHVQSAAEMGNQSLNSLALISARYCQEAVDVLSQLVSAHLFAVCQALDLRAMQIRYLETFEPVFCTLFTDHLAQFLVQNDIVPLQNDLWTLFTKALDDTSTLDPHPRFTTIFQSLQPTIISTLPKEITANPIPALQSWTSACTVAALTTFHKNRETYTLHPDAAPYLGMAARRVYMFVRREMGVPFIASTKPTATTVATESGSSSSSTLDGAIEQDSESAKGVVGEDMTVGAYITRIYQAVRGRGLFAVGVECLEEARR
ncbi:MAG: hypothetical protein Q9222_003007 [Ikaeria aurantiellina]